MLDLKINKILMEKRQKSKRDEIKTKKKKPLILIAYELA